MTVKNTICVVGNPNCGKTTLFNALTGAKQTVGNWPGVTVEKKSGSFKLNDRDVTLVDLPGIYSLLPSSVSSEDERIARDYIFENEAEAVINIVDASNLERNLYLTAQLLEMQVPMIVAVNMVDVAKNHQIEIDCKALSKKLGCPVIPLVASRNQGVDELKAALDNLLENPRIPLNPIHFSKEIEEGIDRVARELKRQGVERADWVAEQILEGDRAIEDILGKVDLSFVHKIEKELNDKFSGRSGHGHCRRPLFLYLRGCQRRHYPKRRSQPHNDRQDRQNCSASLVGFAHFPFDHVCDVHIRDQYRFRFY